MHLIRIWVIQCRVCAAASVSSRPLVRCQTVMNAAIGIIRDLTVKSCRPWTMRVRKNNRGERIPRYTHHLSNGSGMAAPVSSTTETGLKGFTVCLEAWQDKLNRANYITARWPKCLKISNRQSPLMCVEILTKLGVNSDSFDLFSLQTDQLWGQFSGLTVNWNVAWPSSFSNNSHGHCGPCLLPHVMVRHPQKHCSSARECLFYLWPRFYGGSWRPPRRSPLRRRRGGWWSSTASAVERSRGGRWKLGSL